jgi:hypothetical protein
VAATEFTSTEDGQHFIQRLEGFPNEILSSIAKNGPQISASTVDHLLAVIQHDGTNTTVTAYVNELELSTLIRVGRAIQTGEPVFKNDIVDIHSFRVEGVDIPKTAGILFLFSVGWRKGMFYDFRPLPPHNQRIEYDLDQTLGQFYAQVMFQERFSITEEDWGSLLKSGWFPFNSLKHDTIQTIVNYVRNDWDQTEMIKKVASDLNQRINDFRQNWQRQSVFADHANILIHALDRFVHGDYISCVSILYPRIEGLLRSFHTAIGSTKKPLQENLAESAVNRYALNERCLLLPHRFQHYLKTVYFQSFDPKNSDIGCSRNSVGHGVANQQYFNQQSAIVGILVVQQLFYFFADSDRQSRIATTDSGA